jgi:hypothetical protein
VTVMMSLVEGCCRFEVRAHQAGMNDTREVNITARGTASSSDNYINI